MTEVVVIGSRTTYLAAVSGPKPSIPIHPMAQHRLRRWTDYVQPESPGFQGTEYLPNMYCVDEYPDLPEGWDCIYDVVGSPARKCNAEHHPMLPRGPGVWEGALGSDTRNIVTQVQWDGWVGWDGQMQLGGAPNIETSMAHGPTRG